MGKFKMPTWLHGHPPPVSDTQRKKNNRKSFASSFTTNGKTSATLVVPEVDDAAASKQSSDISSQMVLLARIISEETAKLENYMRAHDLPSPGLTSGSPADFPRLPDDMQDARMKIIFATKELSALAHGPRESVRWGVWGFLDVLSLQIINHYKIANLVPVDGEISYKDLQTKTTLDPINLARIVRHAMTNYIFHEPKPGFVAHTAASRVLAEDTDLQDWIGFNSEDIFPSASSTIDALKTHPEATSLTRSGFTFAFDTVDKESMFATIGKEPVRAKRLAGAMASLTGGEGYEIHHFVNHVDFEQIDAAGGTFVDIGGSHGFMSVALAKKWKKMKFVVQDLQKTIESAPTPICDDADVASRVELQTHDFFTEQPVKGADVYFFRWIIHNYSTPYAVKILKSLVPSLKPGARILINDNCLRPVGAENPWDEKITRGMDLIMLVLLNAQERDEEEFRKLFHEADPRFEFKGVSRSEGCRMSVVEAVWNPKEAENDDEEEEEEE